MKLKFFFFISVMIVFFPSFVFAGNAFYVDPSSKIDGDGSFAKPWNNISSVNAHRFNTGDDVYFKVGPTLRHTGSKGLRVNWSGTPGDRVYIGAYYGENQFGLNGNSRPILDGQNNVYPSGGVDYGMIDIRSEGLEGYITINDIRINSPKGHGIAVKWADNITVNNCYIYRTPMRGILLGSSSHGVVTSNIVEEASYKTAPGAAILLTGYSVEGAADDHLVSGNTVFHSYEGIGLYKKVTNTLVTDNILYDNRKHHIYIDAGKYNRVENNLVYSSGDVDNWGGAQWGIATNNETQRGYCFTGNNQFYGNVLISVVYGISVGCEIGNTVDTSCNQSNNNIHDNIIINSEKANFKFWNSRSNWNDNVVKNNISWTIIGDGLHAAPSSPVGFSWDINKFDDIVTGSLANNAELYPYPDNVPVSAWSSIIPGTVRVSNLKTLTFDTSVDGKSYVVNLLSRSPDPLRRPFLRVLSDL
jgi:parallel beta-helix repeat protein